MYVLGCFQLCDPIDGRPWGSSVHGIFQARILEWVAISFARRYSQSRNQTQVSCIARKFFYQLSYKESPRHIGKQIPNHCLTMTSFWLSDLEIYISVWLSLENYIGERNGNPLQYSCLENSMDTAAWQATVRVTLHVTKSWARLIDCSSDNYIHF